jgi:hypothetical protein
MPVNFESVIAWLTETVRRQKTHLHQRTVKSEASEELMKLYTRLLHKSCLSVYLTTISATLTGPDITSIDVIGELEGRRT